MARDMSISRYDDVSVGDEVTIIAEFSAGTSSILDNQTATVIAKSGPHAMYPYRVKIADGGIGGSTVAVHSVRKLKDDDENLVTAVEVTATMRKFATRAGLDVEQTIDLMLTLIELGVYDRGIE